MDKISEKKKLKIFLVVTRGVVGGAQKAVFELADFFKKNSHDVLVGYGDGDYLKEECDREGIKTKQFKYLSRSHNPLSILFFILEIRKFLKQNNFDVVHLNSSNALLAVFAIKTLKKEIRPKIIFTFHGLSFLDENSGGSKIIKYFYRQVFKFLTKFVDENVFVSQANYNFALEKGVVKRGVVIYNGIDQKKLAINSPEFSRNFISEKLKIDLDKKFIIGSIGRLSYPKNYEFLINRSTDLIKKFPELLFVIIGDGPEREKYINLIEKLNLTKKVLLVGEIKNASQYIKGFDLFVLPSRYEGFSVTLVEALFAGIPILASDVGGAKEQLGHAPEQIYKFDDSIDYKNKIEKLISDSDLRKKNSKLNIQKSKDFLIGNLGELCLHIYNK